MPPRRTARLDIRIGVFASAAAVCGLAVSILRGNEDAALIGRIETKDQIGLLLVAVTIFALAALKSREYRRLRKR